MMRLTFLFLYRTFNQPFLRAEKSGIYVICKLEITPDTAIFQIKYYYTSACNWVVIPVPKYKLICLHYTLLLLGMFELHTVEMKWNFLSDFQRFVKFLYLQVKS